MTAEVTTTKGGSIVIPEACGCGCGAPINQKIITALQYKKLGITYRDQERRNGWGANTLKVMVANPSRFVVGHQPKTRWVDRECVRCGASVKTSPTKKNPHCRKICVPWEQWIAANYADYDSKRSAEVAQISRNRAVIVGQRRAERELSRRANLYRTPIDVLRAERRKTVEEWLSQQDPEVRALLEEQKRDALRFKAQWAPSLDDTYEDEGDRGVRSAILGAVYFDRPEDSWQYHAGQHRGRRVRVGPRSRRAKAAA